jgi:hypothetical protein
MHLLNLKKNLFFAKNKHFFGNFAANRTQNGLEKGKTALINMS